MAIFSSGSFTIVANKIASTSFTTITSGSIATGSLAILFVATDPLAANTGSSNYVLSITDPSVSAN